MAAQKAIFSKPAGSIWPWLGLALVIFIGDVLIKQFVLSNYQLGEGTPITGFFNFVRAHNPGAAFSFLAGAGGWQRWFFTTIGVVASVFIIWMLRTHAGQRLFSFALACILGGAIGNVVDRLRHGYVVDFFDFYVGSWHYPTFNTADVAICIGAACLILDEIRRSRRKK